MPSIIPTTMTENPDFETIINYNLHFEKKYYTLGQKFVRHLIEENDQLPQDELKKKINSDLYTFFMSAQNYLKERLGE